jgi:hypothetical protein
MPIFTRNLVKVLQSLSAPFALVSFSKTLYHGSTKPIKDWSLKGAGRYGEGLYLTPDLSIADFYSRGGRQGGGSEKIGDKGFIYAFKVVGKALKISDEQETMQEMVGSYDPASEAFEYVGDLLSAKVTKHLGDWASDEHGVHIVWLNEKGSAISPLPQILVTDMSVIKKISNFES